MGNAREKHRLNGKARAYIDADAYREKLVKRAKEHGEVGLKNDIYGFEVSVRILDSMPTIEVERGEKTDE